MKIHLDLDCFFVSAERARYPFLNGKCVVVAKGSDKKIFSNTKKDGRLLQEAGAFNSILQFDSNYDKSSVLTNWKKEFIDEDGAIHAIVIAKSYECKPYGIKTGTHLGDAFCMCKELIVLPSDHMYYQSISHKLKEFLDTKIPLIEQYSIDEFFGDLTGWINDEDVYDFINDLQAQIMDIFSLPISIAASESKWIAKLATDKIKPYGVKVVTKEKVDEFTQDIGINEFPGIGKSISKRLASYYINTISQAKQYPSIFDSYGKMGKVLYKRICGIDNEAVIPSVNRKGIGISRNFSAIISREELLRRVAILARYLSHTILKLNLNPTTFYFKIKYEYNLKASKSITIDRVFNEKFLIDLAKEMFLTLDTHHNYKIHKISMNASNFTSTSNQKTLSLLTLQKDISQARLSQSLVKIRDKYGIDIIKYGIENIP
ncbi:DNA polymerase IV [Arcobacter sp. FWKO B]|uniref:Y-family DNA polymerase n=1 Tax=Arcobacter sp. FWKO B TaxID=2593672 RepID=UPI0019069559|nr:DNA polymerase IV [Arcobacter sp. FWKO B]